MTLPSNPSTDSASKRTRKRWAFAWPAMRDVDDLLAAIVLVILAFWATVALPPGSWARVAVVAPLVLALPGYLLIQAVLGPTSLRTSRLGHTAAALGVTPAVIGLLALSTTVLPGGFRIPSITKALAIGSVVFLVVAWVRRGFPRASAVRPSNGIPSTPASPGQETVAFMSESMHPGLAPAHSRPAPAPQIAQHDGTKSPAQTSTTPVQPGASTARTPMQGGNRDPTTVVSHGTLRAQGVSKRQGARETQFGAPATRTFEVGSNGADPNPARRQAHGSPRIPGMPHGRPADATQARPGPHSNVFAPRTGSAQAPTCDATIRACIGDHNPGNKACGRSSHAK